MVSRSFKDYRERDTFFIMLCFLAAAFAMYFFVFRKHLILRGLVDGYIIIVSFLSVAVGSLYSVFRGENNTTGKPFTPDQFARGKYKIFNLGPEPGRKKVVNMFVVAYRDRDEDGEYNRHMIDPDGFFSPYNIPVGKSLEIGILETGGKKSVVAYAYNEDNAATRPTERLLPLPA